jgi:hypothetical protein
LWRKFPRIIVHFYKLVSQDTGQREEMPFSIHSIIVL